MVDMRDTTPKRISVSLALDSLREAVAETDEAQTRLSIARGLRDDLIRDALDGGVTMVKLARVTGLSRERLYKIANQPFHADKRAV